MPPKSTPKGTPGSAKTKKVLHYDYISRGLFIVILAGVPDNAGRPTFCAHAACCSRVQNTRLENVIDLNMVENDGKASL